MSTNTRGQWGTKIGFIMAAAGSAIGLGNIWRFPYTVSENGGGAFVLIYILCVLLLGFPLLITEIALGRMNQKGTVSAFETKKYTFLKIIPFLAILTSFMILSYYVVIAGWIIGFLFITLFKINVNFTEFISDAKYTLSFTILFFLATIFIVKAGISKGIEKTSKIMMPLFFIIILGIATRTMFLDGALAGIKYYLQPDFSKITGNVFLSALGQSFLSLSLGMGVLITYGSYLDKKTNIITAAFWVTIMDTLIAIFAGLMIFPAIFAFGKEPQAGPTLVFTILPEIFNAMPFGNIIGALFFLLLSIAAITSSISVFEVSTAHAIDQYKWSRQKACYILGTIGIIFAIPSALSTGANQFLSTELSINFFGKIQTGLIDILDFSFGTFFIVITTLLISIYAGWFSNLTHLKQEITESSPNFNKKIIGVIPSQLFLILIRWIIPLIILIILADIMNLI